MAGPQGPQAGYPGRPREARVPFVRRCQLTFEDGRTRSAFMVNINVNGAYVARDDVYAGSSAARPAFRADDADMPQLNQAVVCTFPLPGRSDEVEIKALVTWLNPRQQHPVHSLPPGFGLKFLSVPEPARQALERFVQEYLMAQAVSGRR